MRKNKGIVIELTALLDVIFIMLFWVMINVQESNTRVREEADSRVSQVQEEAAAQLESLREQTDSELKAAQEKLDRIDKNALANQQALDDFGEGLTLTLNLRYEAGKELTITNGSKVLGTADVSSENEVYTALVAALGKAGIEREDVVLCAFVYDGGSALYRDVSTVTEAVGRVGKSYGNFYCTYINTAR
ncbi:hypothetical protein [Ruminococcus sp.]|uniref:hypothetical protein n=1 Tax=Ruminococcus sp. TaxID=41978 RepID=UPI0025EA05DA|nr:hypothetical protein [Ruminococcus sp.]MBQ8966980.1 hypothetical protein [Ruminococcus sp.]